MFLVLYLFCLKPQPKEKQMTKEERKQEFGLRHAHTCSGFGKTRQELVSFLMVLFRLDLCIPCSLPLSHKAFHAIVIKISDIKRCHLLLLANLSRSGAVWAEPANMALLTTFETKALLVRFINVHWLTHAPKDSSRPRLIRSRLLLGRW